MLTMKTKVHVLLTFFLHPTLSTRFIVYVFLTLFPHMMHAIKDLDAFTITTTLRTDTIGGFHACSIVSDVCRKYLQIATPILILCVVRVNVYTSVCVIEVERVSSCPVTKEEWLMAAKRKNCSLRIPKCANTDPLKYHCLINAWENATYELCGVDIEIIGFYCAEYNEGGKRIQSKYGRSCKYFEPGCPFKYNSSTGYLYPKCYKLLHSDLNINGTLSIQQSGETTHVPTTTRENEMSPVVIAMPLVVLLLILIATILYMIARSMLKGRMQTNEIQETTQEIPMVEDV